MFQKWERGSRITLTVVEKKRRVTSCCDKGKGKVPVERGGGTKWGGTGSERNVPRTGRSRSRGPSALGVEGRAEALTEQKRREGRRDALDYIGKINIPLRVASGED